MVRMKFSNGLAVCTATILAIGLAACSTSRTHGGGPTDLAVNDDAAHAAAPDGLARCDRRLGTVAITEADGNAQALTSAGLPRSMAPLVRHMMSRTRCFRVVDRGAAFALLEQEAKLRERLGQETGPEFRKLEVADYLLRAEIVFAEQTDGAKGVIGSMFGNVLGGIGGQYAKKEAVVLLSVVDARSSEIISSVFGRGASESTSLGSAVLAGGGVLVDAGWGDTPQAKTVAAALVDAWNRSLPRLLPATGAVPAKQP